MNRLREAVAEPRGSGVLPAWVLCAALVGGCTPSSTGGPGPASPGTDGTGGTDGSELDGTDGGTSTVPPYGQNLVSGGGFEDPELGAWTVDGDCSSVQGMPGLDPPEGTRFLRGMMGQEPMVSCVVSQVVDLAALGFALDAVDAGAVAVEAEALLANLGPEGIYDDQVRLVVRYLAAQGGAELGSLETRFAGTEDWTVFGATGLLPAGTRALGVDVEGRFRSLPDNNSYADDVQVWLREAVVEEPALTLAPLLQDTRTDAMRLAWETDGALAWHHVDFGQSGEGLSERFARVRTLVVDDTHHVHVADLTGLREDTAYDYRVDSGGTQSDTLGFRTAPGPDSSVRLAWLADNQEGWERFRVHLEHIAARRPDLMVVPGDIVQEASNLEEWREWWWGSLVDADGFGSTTPVVVARGNHDLHHPFGYAYSLLPGNEVFYSFRYGPVFVVVLDSQSPPAHVPEPINQQQFLEEALRSEAALTADFRIVTFHQAPFTNSVQDSTDGHHGARDNWVPLFVEHGVDLVVTGHYHSYQRGSLDGVAYAIIGGGGSNLLTDVYDFWEHMTELEQTWHYAMMDAEDGVLTWTVRDLDDAVIDEMTLLAR